MQFSNKTIIKFRINQCSNHWAWKSQTKERVCELRFYREVQWLSVRWRRWTAVLLRRSLTTVSRRRLREVGKLLSNHTKVICFGKILDLFW